MAISLVFPKKSKGCSDTYLTHPKVNEGKHSPFRFLVSSMHRTSSSVSFSDYLGSEGVQTGYAEKSHKCLVYCTSLLVPRPTRPWE